MTKTKQGLPSDMKVSSKFRNFVAPRIWSSLHKLWLQPEKSGRHTTSAINCILLFSLKGTNKTNPWKSKRYALKENDGVSFREKCKVVSMLSNKTFLRTRSNASKSWYAQQESPITRMKQIRTTKQRGPRLFLFEPSKPSYAICFSSSNSYFMHYIKHQPSCLFKTSSTNKWSNGRFPVKD